jgi:hypothetical protein
VPKDTARRFEAGFVEKAIRPGETVLCRRRLHPILIAPALALIAPSAFLTVWPSPILLGLAFGGLIIGALAVLTLTTSEVAVTDRRLLGQVHGARFVVPLEQVRVARARSGWLGRRLGLGTLSLELSMQRSDLLVLRGVLDPLPLATAINDAVAAARRSPDDAAEGPDRTE